jgi:hypothetical protein
MIASLTRSKREADCRINSARRFQPQSALASEGGQRGFFLRLLEGNILDFRRKAERLGQSISAGSSLAESRMNFTTAGTDPFNYAEHVL